MELSKEEILGFAVDGALYNLEEYRMAGVSHEHKEVDELTDKYRFLYNEYRKEHIKNLTEKGQ